jgi:hypothetical protein
MPVEAANLVIRTHRPWLHRLFWIAGVALVPLCFYLTYEFGRFDGGYDRLSVSQRRRELEVEIERLEKTNADLRARVAELETGQMSHQQETAELGRSVAELQSQVARQSQDLAFYRGIVGSTIGAPGIKVQRFQVRAGTAPDRFHLRMVLVQAVRPDNIVSGTVALTVQGTERGQSVTYNLARLTADGRDQLPFSFRYVQDLDQEVVLPDGFAPARVSVEVRASGRSGAPFNQSFDWNVQPT